MSDSIKTAQTPTVTGYLAATINGDDNYYTKLEAAEGEGTLRSAAIRLAASNPGPVRDALLPVLQKTAAKDNDDLWEQVGELDEAMAEVRKSLGRFNRAAKAKGLTGLVKAVKAFVDADTAFFNALDALLDESKTAAGAPKVVDPLKKLKALAAKLKFPAGSKVYTIDNSISYYKKGGQALFNVHDRVLEAARSLGFSKKTSSPSGTPDGSNVGGRGGYVDAEGNELLISYNIGSTAYDNWLSLDLSLKK